MVDRVGDAVAIAIGRTARPRRVGLTRLVGTLIHSVGQAIAIAVGRRHVRPRRTAVRRRRWLLGSRRSVAARAAFAARAELEASVHAEQDPVRGRAGSTREAWASGNERAYRAELVTGGEQRFEVRRVAAEPTGGRVHRSGGEELTTERGLAHAIAESERRKRLAAEGSRIHARSLAVTRPHVQPPQEARVVGAERDARTGPHVPRTGVDARRRGKPELRREGRTRHEALLFEEREPGAQTKVSNVRALGIAQRHLARASLVAPLAQDGGQRSVEDDRVREDERGAEVRQEFVVHENRALGGAVRSLEVQRERLVCVVEE